MDKRELMKKIIFIKEASTAVGRKRHIVFYNGLPILISNDALKTGINSTYISSRDESYLDLPEELLGIEMKRAKAITINTVTVIRQVDSQ